VVEYITVPEVGRPLTVPVPPADLLDPRVRADTSRPQMPPPAPAPPASSALTAAYPTVAPVSPAAGTATGPAPDRTRNGLVKRPPRARTAASAGTGPSTVERPAALDESPAQLRDRLVSLRAGVRRGETQREVDPERGSRER
jgi:hypothetical protein